MTVVPTENKPKKNKGGRPTIYTDKLATDICSRMSKGEAVIAICRDPDMPNESTIYEWVLDGKHEEFSKKYARAREMQAERMAEEIIEISDAADKVIKSGAEKKSSAYAANQRLRVDSRKWIASKLLPKKYGDKLDLTSDGKALPVPILGGAGAKTLPKNVPRDNSTEENTKS